MQTIQKIGNIEITRMTVLMCGADGSEIQTIAQVTIRHPKHVEVVVGDRVAQIAAEHPMTADEVAAHAAERENLRKYQAK